MKSIYIDETHANKSIDRVIREVFPKMPVSAMYKAFRKKDIKVNGTRVKENCTVSFGDKLEVFIVDSILEGTPLTADKKKPSDFSIVYEDPNVLVVNKQPGIPVHPDQEQSENTLIDQVQKYLNEKGEYKPEKATAFPPSLCHRLDRNTGGLVIVAKNEGSLRILLDKIKNKEVKKYYQCLVKGKMEPSQAELKAFLEKDEYKSRVFVKDEKTKGALEIITRYRVISCENDISKLDVELVTGRTHQIRAHLAHIGHPIIGDGKYGLNSVNRALGVKYQALWAYKIIFDFHNTGLLGYLSGKTIEVEPEFSALKTKGEQ